MKVYVSNYLSNSISILDYETLEVEREIVLEENIYPHNFCIDKEKNLMYIPSSVSGNLYILDLNTYSIVDSLSIGGNISNIILNNGELFLVNEDSNSIYIIDVDNLKPVGVVSVDEMPHGLDIDNTDNKLYIPCTESIICIDTVSKEIYNKIHTGFKSWHLKVNSYKDELYATTIEGRVLILEEKNMKIKNIIENFLLPIDIVISNINKKIYIADMGYKSIIILDLDSKEILNTIEVDGYPQGLSICKNDGYLFVSDTQKNSIKVYNTLDNELIKEIKVGKEPTTILCL